MKTEQLKEIKNAVKVFFANSSYNYTTSVSNTATKESLQRYFVGQRFNVTNYPNENMQVCTGIEFINN